MNNKLLEFQKTKSERFRDRLYDAFLLDSKVMDATYRHCVEPVPFKERLNLEERKIREGETFGNLWENAWFHITCDIKPEWIGKPVWVRLNLGGEILIFDELGVPVFGLTHHSLYNPYYKKEYFEITKCAKKDTRIDLWCEVAANGLFGADEKGPAGICTLMRAGVYDAEMHQLFNDVNILTGFFEIYKKPCAAIRRIANALEEAEAVFADDPENASAAREILKKHLDFRAADSELTSATVGHAHIDVGWLWPVRESIRKAARTFSSQIANIEKYPEYIFGASQPQLYMFIKEHYPELYKKIKKQVKAGRWECQGGMWVEADCNIISGESMVRQFLHGKNFFMDEFGVDVKNLWIPDVFGYSAAMPQIIKKSGCDYFLTQKISWNQFNKFPYHTFMWQGIDGSKVLTHFPPEDTYNSNLTPDGLVKARDNFNESAFIDEFMTLAGIGDGGGGPSMRHIENGLRCADLEGVPKVKFCKAADFFERIKKHIPQLPSWVGELYLELHRGTLTSQSRTKRGNRKCEELLAATEFIYSCLPLDKYPAAELDQMWKLLLCNQFHDIIPGSSIRQVYTVAEQDYANIIRKCETLIRNAEKLLSDNDSATLTLLNTLSYPVSKVITLPPDWKNCNVIDTATGMPLAVQHNQNETLCLINIPPCSSLVIKKQYDANTADSVVSDALVLENELIRYTFDQDAQLVSAYDKTLNRELISGAGNRLAVYVDQPINWDAWDIDHTYMKTPALPAKGKSARKNFSGALKQELEFELAVGKSSKLRQKISLDCNSKRLDFVTDADWKECHRMLRVSFQSTVNTTEATCDIQYGYIKRPTHSNTSWDFARFETAAHKYVDITDENCGIALLNDCKYGYHLSSNTLDLNLLRSSKHPDTEADIGCHRFTYSFMPHEKTLTESDVLREAAQLNRELIMLNGYAAIKTPFEMKNICNVSLGALKKAEKSDDIIIRLVETCGKNGSVTLNFANPVTIINSDLLEWNEEDVYIRNTTVCNLNFTPFEIKTLKVKLQEK